MRDSNVSTETATIDRAAGSRSSTVPALRRVMVFGLIASLGLAAPLSAQASGGGPIAVDDDFTIATSHVLIVDWSELVNNDKTGDSGPLTAHQLPGGTQHGSLKFVDHSPLLEPYFEYTSINDYTGPDSFSYTVTDSTGIVSNSATVNIAVVQNSAPVAVADHYSTTPNTAFAVQSSSGIGGNGLVANDTDADHDWLEVVPGSVTPVQHGTLTMDVKGGDGFSYTPAANYVGTDSFSYTAHDNYGGLTTDATVTIVVKPVPPMITPTLPVMAKAVVRAVSLGTPTGKPGQTIYLVSRIASATGIKSGAAVSAYIDGVKGATRTTDVSGVARIPVKLPATAGKHRITLVSGAATVTKSITLGAIAKPKLGRVKPVRAKKTATITGSFGTTTGRVTVKVTDPSGKVTSKTVSLGSTGKFSYKYTTAKKGSYRVSYSYLANAKYYGAKSYTTKFTAK